MTTAAVQAPKPHGMPDPPPASVKAELPPFDGATAWLNSPPLTAAALRGKVVLVDFWTYSCINWARTHPYVRAWAEKYKSHGLVVIGVHTPEFAFEKDIDNVRRAAKDMKVNYPIATDNDYAIWRAFNNNYWPALYFIDAQGRMRHHHFGEGAYDRSERMIQQLLTEAGNSGVSRELVSVDAQGVEADADWRNLKSSETYVGYARAENFASPGGAVRDKQYVYAIPAQLRLNHWALSGDWTVGTTGHGAEQAQRTNRTSLSCARCSSRHGAGSPRNRSAVSRADRWKATRRRTRNRHRRARQWHGHRAAAIPTDSPADPHC